MLRGSWSRQPEHRAKASSWSTSWSSCRSGPTTLSCQWTSSSWRSHTLSQGILIDHYSSETKSLIWEFMFLLQATDPWKFGSLHKGLPGFAMKSIRTRQQTLTTWWLTWQTLPSRRTLKSTTRSMALSGTSTTYAFILNRPVASTWQINVSMTSKTSFTFLSKVCRQL